MAYHWRIINLAGAVPAYGDVLENIWAIDWFLDGLRVGEGLRLFAPHIFMPEGWALSTFANGLGVFALAVPIAALTGAAVAFNVLQLAGFFIAYFGAYRLGRLVAGQGAAILVALLYLLWGGRWLRVGHLNILLGSALLPWLILALERALADRPGRWRWAVVAGLVWAPAITFSLYFIWMGFFLCVAWLLGAALARHVSWRGALGRLIVAGGVTVLVCAPYFYIYWRSQSAAAGWDVRHVNVWNMSLDWLPAYFPDHRLPFLRELSARQVDGVRIEGSFSGFGILLPLVALLGLATARTSRWLRQVKGSTSAAIVIGVILALGMTLTWNNKYIPAPALRPLNEAIWDVGRAVKPEVFPGPDAPPEFAEAIPLPGLLLAAVVPFFEDARVSARYLMIAAPALLLLVAVGLERLPRTWLKVALAALLLVEAARYPLTGARYPPPASPAFAWLAERPPGPGESVLDITAPGRDFITLGVGGEVLAATGLHGWPIAGGGGSILPAHAAYLRDWLHAHPDPADAAEFPTLLRDYGIRFVLLHMPPNPADGPQRLAAGTDELIAAGCHDNSAKLPWDRTICILEVAPAALPVVNVHLARGWSGVEPWGVWALGRESAIGWAATQSRETRFAVEAFPFCVDNAPTGQTVEFVVGDRVVGDRVVAAHRWDTCDAAHIEVVVPAELVAIGWNEMTLRFGRADRPADVTGGDNPDGRELSVGFSRLERLIELTTD